MVNNIGSMSEKSLFSEEKVLDVDIGKATIYLVDSGNKVHAHQAMDFPSKDHITDADVIEGLDPGFDPDTVEYQTHMGQYNIGLMVDLRGVYEVTPEQFEIIRESMYMVKALKSRQAEVDRRIEEAEKEKKDLFQEEVNIQRQTSRLLNRSSSY